jgi:hypothetical protein
MKTIELTQGKVAIVDDEDYEYLNQWKWYAHSVCGHYYAIRNLSVSERTLRNGYQVKMHREIIGTEFEVIDHIDRDGLNNQRCNLRPCSKSQNAINSKKRVDGSTSKHKGVYFTKNGWAARINVMGVQKWGGRHKKEIDAARKYNEMAIKYFGAFARLNEIAQ